MPPMEYPVQVPPRHTSGTEPRSLRLPCVLLGGVGAHTPPLFDYPFFYPSCPLSLLTPLKRFVSPLSVTLSVIECICQKACLFTEMPRTVILGNSYSTPCIDSPDVGGIADSFAWPRSHNFGACNTVGWLCRFRYGVRQDKSGYPCTHYGPHAVLFYVSHTL